MSFVVMEGLDGSGKSTQLKLLRQYLEENKIVYKYLHFPSTGSGIFGELIAMFLRGELGKMKEVNPYLVSLIYAANRHDAREDILDWLAEGHFLLLDRYVMSNVAYQCAKMETSRQRKELKDWIFHLEYIHYRIPRPDINIFLDVPLEFTKAKLSDRRTGTERAYLKGRQDIHEASILFQQKVREAYLEQAAVEENLRIITCYDENEKILKPVEIFNLIINLLEKENFL